MHEKLKQIENRYAEIQTRMLQPEVYADPAEYARLAREQKELAPLAEAYRRWTRLAAEAEDARILMNDAEMRALAREEYDALRADMEREEQNIRLLLLPRDPNDDKKDRKSVV